jgi:hypothetical protein
MHGILGMHQVEVEVFDAAGFQLFFKQRPDIFFFFETLFSKN